VSLRKSRRIDNRSGRHLGFAGLTPFNYSAVYDMTASRYQQVPSTVMFAAAALAARPRRPGVVSAKSTGTLQAKATADFPRRAGRDPGRGRSAMARPPSQESESKSAIAGRADAIRVICCSPARFPWDAFAFFAAGVRGRGRIPAGKSLRLFSPAIVRRWILLPHRSCEPCHRGPVSGRKQEGRMHCSVRRGRAAALRP